MKQEIIDVELTVQGDEETDILCFKLSPDIIVSLNGESSQQDLKIIFSKLLEKMIDTEIELTFSIAPGYSKGLYKEVCAEYISELNRELKRVQSEVRKTLSIKE